MKTETVITEYSELLSNAARQDKKKSTGLDYKHFVGPKPVSLEMDHVQEVVDSQPNKRSILKGYTVTDKADGEGNLLFINNEGDAYLIDPSMRVRSAGFRCTACKNTLLNGEYITRDLKGRLQFAFYVYDAYVCMTNQDTIDRIWMLPLVTSDADKTKQSMAVRAAEAKLKSELAKGSSQEVLNPLKEAVRLAKCLKRLHP